MSGNEPTLNELHLLKLLELIESKNKYQFILETNGILLANKQYAKKLSKFSCLHVRVSLKGTTPTEFARFTLCSSKGFDLQLKAISNLLDYGISCHAALISIATQDRQYLINRLNQIDPSFASGLEIEPILLYPQVKLRLKKAGII